MRKLSAIALTALLLAGCTSPAPLDTGIVQYKHYWKAGPQRIGKITTMRPEQWCLYVLADAWLDERRPHPAQRSETYDHNLQSKHTHTVCLPESEWQGYQDGDVWTW